MELRHLRYFVAVAEELHFSRAALRLHIGQPPLSAQIQALERELGAVLLERTKRWVRLTDAGKLFLDDARRILSLADQAGETARRASRGEVGQLRVGFTSSMPFSEILPRVVNQYRLHYPQVNLSLQEMPSMRQFEAIADRTLDLGFVRPPEVAIDRGISVLTLRHDPLVLVMPTTHRLARRKSISFKDLNKEVFVMYSRDVGTGLHMQIHRLCHAAGFEPAVSQEAREASTIIGLVAAGCGVSVLPESFQCIKMTGVCYRTVTDDGATTALMLARRADETSALVEEFFRLALAPV
ncbi:MAG TPA: LysR family transcriptional regulator [Burkholderiaceae bacterium]|jgi:DNA-binding transcriptional LysR family regulator